MRLPSRCAALALLGIAVSFAAPAEARPAACDVRVGGFQPVRGPCDFRPEPGGSFHLSGARRTFLTPTQAASYAEQDSLYVKRIAPDVALLFGIGGAHQTGTYLATLHRHGACWTSLPPADTINGDAQVCAR